MLISISILTALAIAAMYPLCFWIRVDDSFRSKFRKFNMTLPNVIGGFVVVSIWLIDIPLSLKIIVTAWKALLLSVSSYSWKQEYPDPKLMTLPCLLGIYAFIRLQAYFLSSGGTIAFINLFGG